MHEGGLHDSVFGVLGYRLRSATGGSMKLKYGTNPHQAFAAAEPVAPGTEPLRLRNGNPSLINLLDEIAQGLAPRPKLSPGELSALLSRVEERRARWATTATTRHGCAR